VKYTDFEVTTVKMYVSERKFATVKAQKTICGVPYGPIRDVKLFQIVNDWHDMDTGLEMPDQRQLKYLYWAAEARQQLADAVAKRMEEADKPKAPRVQSALGNIAGQQAFTTQAYIDKMQYIQNTLLGHNS
jgi:hypothetical protein